MYPMRRRPMPGDRLFGPGFLGPFVLGGLVGGLAAPAFYPRPVPYGPYPVPYAPYPPYPVIY